MIDDALAVLVLGVVLIAVAVDAGALASWLHSRWRASR
jgi:hypothetical protein